MNASAVEKKSSSVELEIAQLDKATGELMAALGVLENRLEPVILHQPEKSPALSVDEPNVPACDIAIGIRQRRQTIETLIARVSALIYRLDI